MYLSSMRLPVDNSTPRRGASVSAYIGGNLARFMAREAMHRVFRDYTRRVSTEPVTSGPECGLGDDYTSPGTTDARRVSTASQIAAQLQSPSKLARGYYVTDSMNVSNSLLTLTLTLTLTLLSSGFRWVTARFFQKPTGFRLGYEVT